VLKLALFDMGNTLLDYHAGPSSDEEKDQRGLIAMSRRLTSWGFSVTMDDLKVKFYQPWIALCATRRQASREFDLLPLLDASFPARRLTQSQLKILLLDFHGPSVDEAITDEGAQSSLADLKAAGLKIGMISNTAIPGYCHDMTLERLGLSSFIDFRLYSYDEGIRKPHRELFLRGLRMADSPPEVAVMVGW